MIIIQNKVEFEPKHMFGSSVLPSIYNFVHIKITSIESDLNKIILDENITVIVTGNLGNISVYTNSLKGQNHEKIVLAIHETLRY